MEPHVSARFEVGPINRLEEATAKEATKLYLHFKSAKLRFSFFLLVCLRND